MHAQDTTAWRGERFAVNVAGVVGRSDVVLGRADTLPYRHSTGHVTIPGLVVLTSARDYAGRLDLYDGAFLEHDGMTATADV